MKNIFAVLFLGLVISFSCKKDEKELSRTELICKGNWVVTQAKIEPAVQGSTSQIGDITNSIATCYQDDRSVFSSSGTYTYNRGGNTCSTSENASYTGSWAFINSENQVKIKGFNGYSFEYIFSVYELGENIMKLHYPIKNHQDLVTILDCFGLSTMAKAGSPDEYPTGTYMKITFVIR